MFYKCKLNLNDMWKTSDRNNSTKISHWIKITQKHKMNQNSRDNIHTKRPVNLVLTNLRHILKQKTEAKRLSVSNLSKATQPFHHILTCTHHLHRTEQHIFKKTLKLWLQRNTYLPMPPGKPSSPPKIKD